MNIKIRIKFNSNDFFLFFCREFGCVVRIRIKWMECMCISSSSCLTVKKYIKKTQGICAQYYVGSITSCMKESYLFQLFRRFTFVNEWMNDEKWHMMWYSPFDQVSVRTCQLIMIKLQFIIIILLYITVCHSPILYWKLFDFWINVNEFIEWQKKT